MIHEKFRIALVTASMGLVTTITEENKLKTGLALIESVSKYEIRFFTFMEHVKNLEEDHMSELVLSIQDSQFYMAVTGKAKMVRDIQLVGRLWDEHKENWLHTSKAGDQIYLINLVANEIKEWDGSN